MAINAKEKLSDPRIIRVRSEWNDLRIVSSQIIFHYIPEMFGIKFLIGDQIVQFADETKIIRNSFYAGTLVFANDRDAVHRVSVSYPPSGFCIMSRFYVLDRISVISQAESVWNKNKSIRRQFPCTPSESCYRICLFQDRSIFRQSGM